MIASAEKIRSRQVGSVSRRPFNSRLCGDLRCRIVGLSRTRRRTWAEHDGRGETLADARTGKNERHALIGLLRQSVFGPLAGYEDVNDAERLRHDPAIRWIVGGKAAHRGCSITRRSKSSLRASSFIGATPKLCAAPPITETLPASINLVRHGNQGDF